MMLRGLLRCLPLLLVGMSSGIAQSTVRLDSGGSKIVVTVWAAPSKPEATVLLVPGWAAGPTDVLGIGRALSAAGISVVVLTPRGWHESEGTATFANALNDIGVALDWIRKASRADLNASNIALGGHSWGGGMSLAYAARDTSVKRVFSVAGTDHAQLIRQHGSDADFATSVDRALASSAAPRGPIRFEVERALQELVEGQAVYGLLENASRLVDRSILLFGGWEDVNVTVDHTLLPFYRRLRGAGAQDVTFETYHTDHGFGRVRSELIGHLAAWIRR